MDALILRGPPQMAVHRRLRCPLIVPGGAPGPDSSTSQAHPLSSVSSSTIGTAPPPPPRGALAFQGPSCVPLSRTEPLVTHRWQGRGRGPWQSIQLFSATGLESCGPQLTLTPRQGLESGVGPAKDRATSSSGSLRPEDLAGSSQR